MGSGTVAQPPMDRSRHYLVRKRPSRLTVSSSNLKPSRCISVASAALLRSFSSRSALIGVSCEGSVLGCVKMSGEGLRVRVVQCLQFWRNSVVIVVCRCCPLVFGTSADSQEQEQVENFITSNDGETASPPDGEWDITNGLNAESCAPQELQISNIDPAGEYKVPLGLAGEASQPTDAAAAGPSAQCQIPSPRSSREDSEERGIITAQRTQKPDIQDVKIGNEDLVVNTRYVQIEFLNQDHVYIGVDAFYEAQFRTFGKPELDNAAAGGLPVEAKPFKDSGHVPPSVSEGSVPTFAMHVDKTKTTLVPSLEKRRTSAGEGAEVLANLEQTPSTQKNLQMENDSSDSLGQGFSSCIWM